MIVIPMEWLETRTEGQFSAKLLAKYFNEVLKPFVAELKKQSHDGWWQASTSELLEQQQLLMDTNAALLVRVGAAHTIAITLNRLENHILAVQAVLTTEETLFHILKFLSQPERAKFASLSSWIWEPYQGFPLAGKGGILKEAILIREVHKKLSSGTLVGLHSTSSKNLGSLFGGLRVPGKEEQVSDFNQLGSGFYISDGFSQENVDAVRVFGQESTTKKGGHVVVLRVYISGWSGLTSKKVPETQWVKEQRDVGRLSSTIASNNKGYDYLQADIHKFPGATQIKLNPDLIGKIGTSITVSMVPTPDSFDQELWIAWLRYMFPGKFR